MRFMMMFTETAEDFACRSDPARAPAYWAAWMSYIGALQAAGVTVNGAGLQPPETATTVRLRDGRRQVQDGPFADSKEQLAGYFLIEVADLDVALDWAARSPAAASGSVELRPILPPPPGAP
jgi:hypothetical protein